jgi:hypothetical protein
MTRIPLGEKSCWVFLVKFLGSGSIAEAVEGHTVTDAGLIAAAWKDDAGGVAKVFNGQSTSA